MTKAELLAQFEANTKGVNKVELVEEGTLTSGKTFKKYNINVFTDEGVDSNFVNVPMTVVNEGETDEDATTTQGCEIPMKRTVGDKIEKYLSDNQPNVFAWYGKPQVNEVQKAARVTVIDATTFSEQEVLVYRDKVSAAWTHAVITK